MDRQNTSPASASHLAKLMGSNDTLLAPVANTDFIQAITLLHTLDKRRTDQAAGKTGKQVAAVSAKRVAMLALPLTDYKTEPLKWKSASSSQGDFCAKSAFSTHATCPTAHNLFRLPPFLVCYGSDGWSLRSTINSVVGSGAGYSVKLYGGAVETRVANDLEDLLGWFDDDEAIPRTVYEAN